MARTDLTVNGRRRSVEGEDTTPLLWVLRDDLGLTGVKYGCGLGACGACTVLMDGAAVRSCQVTLAAAAGRQVTTIEGLSDDGSHPVQRAWLAENVPQCGYCQTGMILEATALLQRTPHPTDEQIEAALGSHLCRCGTYPRLARAVRRAAGDGTP